MSIYLVHSMSLETELVYDSEQLLLLLLQICIEHIHKLKETSLVVSFLGRQIAVLHTEPDIVTILPRI